MKSTLTSACFAALFVLGNPASAQTSSRTNLRPDPITEASPQAPRMRVDSLKTRHTESLSTLTAALNRIADDPALVIANETFTAIDKADRDMRSSKSACESILAALRSELAAIKADSAFTDDQKTELETAAKAMADECATVRKEADVVIKNLGKACKALAQAKKLFKSYLNLQGESQAKEKLKAAVGEYVKSLTEPPAEAPPAEAPKEEGKSA
jgi:hypothetical protein